MFVRLDHFPRYWWKYRMIEHYHLEIYHWSIKSNISWVWFQNSQYTKSIPFPVETAHACGSSNNFWNWILKPFAKGTVWCNSRRNKANWQGSHTALLLVCHIHPAPLVGIFPAQFPASTRVGGRATHMKHTLPIPYCWWKNPAPVISWYGKYPIICTDLYIPGGWPDFFHQQYVCQNKFIFLRWRFELVKI